MRIRTIERSEVRRAARLVGLNYSRRYERLASLEVEAMFRNYVMKPIYLVAEDNGLIVGLVGYIQSWMDYNIYNIFWVNVHPARQGQGIGRALIQRVVSAIKRKGATLILLTTTKPRFYQGFGFQTLTKFRGKDHLMVLRLR